MIILEMKNCNAILKEKPQKYQHHHLQKLINMNILQVKKYYFLVKEEWQNKLRLSYFPTGKVLEKGLVAERSFKFQKKF